MLGLNFMIQLLPLVSSWFDFYEIKIGYQILLLTISLILLTTTLIDFTKDFLKSGSVEKMLYYKLGLSGVYRHFKKKELYCSPFSRKSMSCKHKTMAKIFEKGDNEEKVELFSNCFSEYGNFTRGKIENEVYFWFIEYFFSKSFLIFKEKESFLLNLEKVDDFFEKKNFNSLSDFVKNIIPNFKDGEKEITDWNLFQLILYTLLGLGKKVDNFKQFEFESKIEFGNLKFSKDFLKYKEFELVEEISKKILEGEKPADFFKKFCDQFKKKRSESFLLFEKNIFYHLIEEMDESRDFGDLSYNLRLRKNEHLDEKKVIKKVYNFKAEIFWKNKKVASIERLTGTEIKEVIAFKKMIHCFRTLIRENKIECCFIGEVPVLVEDFNKTYNYRHCEEIEVVFQKFLNGGIFDQFEIKNGHLNISEGIKTSEIFNSGEEKMKFILGQKNFSLFKEYLLKKMGDQNFNPFFEKIYTDTSFNQNRKILKCGNWEWKRICVDSSYFLEKCSLSAMSGVCRKINPRREAMDFFKKINPKEVKKVPSKNEAYYYNYERAVASKRLKKDKKMEIFQKIKQRDPMTEKLIFQTKFYLSGDNRKKTFKEVLEKGLVFEQPKVKNSEIEEIFRKKMSFIIERKEKVKEIYKRTEKMVENKNPEKSYKKNSFMSKNKIYFQHYKQKSKKGFKSLEKFREEIQKGITDKNRFEILFELKGIELEESRYYNQTKKRKAICNREIKLKNPPKEKLEELKKKEKEDKNYFKEQKKKKIEVREKKQKMEFEKNRMERMKLKETKGKEVQSEKRFYKGIEMDKENYDELMKMIEISRIREKEREEIRKKDEEERKLRMKELEKKSKKKKKTNKEYQYTVHDDYDSFYPSSDYD